MKHNIIAGSSLPKVFAYSVVAIEIVFDRTVVETNDVFFLKIVSSLCSRVIAPCHKILV